MGDVLRSTALLPPLAEAHPRAAITWITRKESVPLLQRNPYVAEVLELGPEALVHLQTRDVRSRDQPGRVEDQRGAGDGGAVEPEGRIRARRARVRAADQRRGAALARSRRVRRHQAPGHRDLSGSDGRRFSAWRAAQHRYVFELGADESARARTRICESIGLDFERPVIGLNTGAGGRWPLKQWREDGLRRARSPRRPSRGRAVPAARRAGGAGAQRTAQGARRPCRCSIPGCDNTVRHFAALLDHCDVVVTGDTLAMHLALALRQADRRAVRTDERGRDRAVRPRREGRAGHGRA